VSASYSKQAIRIEQEYTKDVGEDALVQRNHTAVLWTLTLTPNARKQNPTKKGPSLECCSAVLAAQEQWSLMPAMT
jgi:hypothetical protein